MKNFIFQGSPDIFDIDGYLTEAAQKNIPIRWEVKRYANDMNIGDRAFLWRAAGKQKEVSGVVGVGTIISKPALTKDDELSKKYWREERPDTESVRVEIEVTGLNLGSREVVQRKWMLEDPVLENLIILKMASGTNFPLTPAHAERLLQLATNTGVSWTKEESMAALWLYNETYGKPISRSHDSDVALIALIIGRAVTGVYNKVMNFRSIDPRDGRKGLSGVNIVDREVWSNYFNTGDQQLNVEQLNRDFETIWGSTSAKVEPRTEVPQISEPPEAPDDDIGRKRWVSQTYRKGQPAFRKRLLHLYGGACAITGVAIEAVLDAAHIVDHSKMGINNSDNGLLLRSDIHDLFDCGLIRLDPDNCQVLVDESLKDTSYWKYHDGQIRQRIDGSRPSKELIALKNRATGQ